MTDINVESIFPDLRSEYSTLKELPKVEPERMSAICLMIIAQELLRIRKRLEARQLR